MRYLCYDTNCIYVNPWYFHVHALLLFTKRIAYIFKNKFSENQSEKSLKEATMKTLVWWPKGLMQIIDELGPMLCSFKLAMFCIFKVGHVMYKERKEFRHSSECTPHFITFSYYDIFAIYVSS